MRRGKTRTLVIARDAVPTQKTPREERIIIVGQPHKRPYGVRVRLHVQSSAAFGFVDEVSVPLGSGAFLTIGPGRGPAPWEGGRKYLVTLVGFPTAASAENAGRRLVQGLLWMAVSTGVPLRLEYLSYEPASVFDRTASVGATAEGYGEVGFAPAIVFAELQDGYDRLPQPDEKLLLSMEIFCAARLEASQRAVFLTLVSSLEPLAREADLGPEVAAFVKDARKMLGTAKKIDPNVRASLEGRLLQLRTESIRQALRRLVRTVLPESPDAEQIVDEAYDLRSQLIHNGVPTDLDIDLGRESDVMATIVRRIYSKMLGRKLARDG